MDDPTFNFTQDNIGIKLIYETQTTNSSTPIILQVTSTNRGIISSKQAAQNFFNILNADETQCRGVTAIIAQNDPTFPLESFRVIHSPDRMYNIYFHSEDRTAASHLTGDLIASLNKYFKSVAQRVSLEINGPKPKAEIDLDALQRAGVAAREVIDDGPETRLDRTVLAGFFYNQAASSSEPDIRDNVVKFLTNIKRTPRQEERGKGLIDRITEAAEQFRTSEQARGSGRSRIG